MSREPGQPGHGDAAGRDRSEQPGSAGKPARAAVVECQRCPVGAVSGIAEAQFCPFIVREYPRDAVLYRMGSEADYVWYIRSGVIALTGKDGATEYRHPNSFVGTEAVETGRYAATAQVSDAAVLCGATRDGFARWMTSHASSLCAALCHALPPGPRG